MKKGYVGKRAGGKAGIYQKDGTQNLYIGFKSDKASQYINADLTLEDAGFLDAAATESLGSELFSSFLQSIRDGVEVDG